MGEIVDFSWQIRTEKGGIVTGRRVGLAGVNEGNATRREGCGAAISGHVVREGERCGVIGIRGLLEEIDAVRIDVDHARDPVEIRRNAGAVEGAGNGLRAVDKDPVHGTGAGLLEQPAEIGKRCSEDRAVDGVAEFAIHAVVDPREFPDTVFLDEYAATGITVGEVALIRAAVAVEYHAQHVADTDSEIGDRRNVVLAPALDAVDCAPEPAVGQSVHDNGPTALRAAAKDDEVLVGFIKRGIKRSVAGKCFAHLPDGEVAVESFEGGDGMIGESVEKKNVIGCAANVIRRDEELRGNGCAEIIAPGAFALPTAVGERARGGGGIVIRIAGRLENHCVHTRCTDDKQGNAETRNTTDAAQLTCLTIHNERISQLHHSRYRAALVVSLACGGGSQPANFLDAVFAVGLASAPKLRVSEVVYLR